MQSYARLIVLERVSYSKRIVYCKYMNNEKIYVYNHNINTAEILKKNFKGMRFCRVD